MRRVLVVSQRAAIKPTTSLSLSSSWVPVCDTPTSTSTPVTVSPSWLWSNTNRCNGHSNGITSRLMVRSLTSLSPSRSWSPYHSNSHGHGHVQSRSSLSPSLSLSIAHQWSGLGRYWAYGNHRGVITKANPHSSYGNGGVSRPPYSLAGQRLPLSINDINNASSQNTPSPSPPSSPSSSDSNNEMHPWAYVAYQSSVVFCSVLLFDFLATRTVPLLVNAGVDPLHVFTITGISTLGGAALLSSVISRQWNGRIVNGYRSSAGSISRMLILLPIALIVSLALSQVLPSSENPILVRFVMQPSATTFGTLCVAIPAFEEIMFRGLIFSRIWPVIGLWPAVFVTSALFGVLHNGDDQEKVATVALSSIPFSLLYAATGRLLAPILLHSGVNTVALLLWSLVGPTPLLKDDDTAIRNQRDEMMKLHLVLRMMNQVSTSMVTRWLVGKGVMKARDSKLTDDRGQPSPLLTDFMKRVWNETNQRTLVDRWIVVSSEMIPPASAIIFSHGVAVAHRLSSTTPTVGAALSSPSPPSSPSASSSITIPVDGDVVLPAAVVRTWSTLSPDGQREALPILNQYITRVTDGYRAALIQIYDDGNGSAINCIGSAARSYQPDYDTFMTIIIQASLTQPQRVHALMALYPDQTAAAAAYAATVTPTTPTPMK